MRAVIRVYDAAGDVTETHEHKGDATKVALARRVGNETAVSLKWSAENLYLEPGRIYQIGLTTAANHQEVSIFGSDRFLALALNAANTNARLASQARVISASAFSS